MVILRLREGVARVSSHSRALSGKWTVIFRLKAFKPFISRSRVIFAQRVSRFGFSRPDCVRLFTTRSIPLIGRIPTSRQTASLLYRPHTSSTLVVYEP